MRGFSSGSLAGAIDRQLRHQHRSARQHLRHGFDALNRRIQVPRGLATTYGLGEVIQETSPPAAARRPASETPLACECVARDNEGDPNVGSGPRKWRWCLTRSAIELDLVHGPGPAPPDHPFVFNGCGFGPRGAGANITFFRCANGFCGGARAGYSEIVCDAGETGRLCVKKAKPPPPSPPCLTETGNPIDVTHGFKKEPRGRLCLGRAGSARLRALHHQKRAPRVSDEFGHPGGVGWRSAALPNKLGVKAQSCSLS